MLQKIIARFHAIREAQRHTEFCKGYTAAMQRMVGGQTSTNYWTAFAASLGTTAKYQDYVRGVEAAITQYREITRKV